MKKAGLSLIAKVECREESHAQEQPVAVVIGGERFEITNIVERAMVTGIEAGQPIRNRMWVEIEDGRNLELSRTLPDGRWMVKSAD
jgi:hypothetical protein